MPLLMSLLLLTVLLLLVCNAAYVEEVRDKPIEPEGSPPCDSVTG